MTTQLVLQSQWLLKSTENRDSRIWVLGGFFRLSLAFSISITKSCLFWGLTDFLWCSFHWQELGQLPENSQWLRDQDLQSCLDQSLVIGLVVKDLNGYPTLGQEYLRGSAAVLLGCSPPGTSSYSHSSRQRSEGRPQRVSGVALEGRRLWVSSGTQKLVVKWVKLAGKQEGDGQGKCSCADENLPSPLQRKDSASSKRENLWEKETGMF